MYNCYKRVSSNDFTYDSNTPKPIPATFDSWGRCQLIANKNKLALLGNLGILTYLHIYIPNLHIYMSNLHVYMSNLHIYISVFVYKTMMHIIVRMTTVEELLLYVSIPTFVVTFMSFNIQIHSNKTRSDTYLCMKRRIVDTKCIKTQCYSGVSTQIKRDVCRWNN